MAPHTPFLPIVAILTQPGFTGLTNISKVLKLFDIFRKKLIFGPDLISKVEEFVKCVCNDPVSHKNFGTI